MIVIRSSVFLSVILYNKKINKSYINNSNLLVHPLFIVYSKFYPVFFKVNFNRVK